MPNMHIPGTPAMPPASYYPPHLPHLQHAPPHPPLQVRDQLMDWLCEREMTIYQTIFSMAGESAKLDRFDRRYQWFRARLEEKKVGGLGPGLLVVLAGWDHSMSTVHYCR